MKYLRSPERANDKSMSAQERRKVFENASKKSTSSSSSSSRSSFGVAAKSHNATPKPFNSGVTKATQPYKPPPWGSNLGKISNTNAIATKSQSSAVKSVRAPIGKLAKESDVLIPQLNQDHVKLFNAKEASTKAKVKEPPKVLDFQSKASQPKVNSASRVSSASSTNISHAPRATSASSSAGQRQTNISKSLYSQQQHQAPSQSKKTSPVKKVSTSVSKKDTSITATLPTKPNPPPTNNVKSTGNDLASKAKTSSHQATSPTSASSTKTPVPLQTRASPLSKDSSQAVRSPPTAVVAPMRERSKAISSNNANKRPPVNSGEAARQRSVSTPVAPQKPKTNAVSYQASIDDVMLPEIPVVEKEISEETKKKRSMSELSKVPVQPKPLATTLRLGHDFQPHELKDWMNWCDACGSVILTLFAKSLSCTKCKMVCHVKCALAVSLTCEADEQLRSQTLTEGVLNDGAFNDWNTIVQETTDESTLKEYNTVKSVITNEEVQARIEEFNLTVKGSQQMTLQDDSETFRGFVRVSINLTRPVSVIDSSKTSRKPTNPRKASFYIDKGAVKALHLTSEVTSEQVVKALLLKYNITDNPMKFALFERQAREEGHVILRKMLPLERPLFLRLLWGQENSEKRGFILQENETRDINWESFPVAELYMFIKILDKEENDHILEIKRKYKNKSQDIRMAMEHQQKLATV